MHQGRAYRSLTVPKVRNRPSSQRRHLRFKSGFGIATSQRRRSSLQSTHGRSIWHLGVRTGTLRGAWPRARPGPCALRYPVMQAQGARRGCLRTVLWFAVTDFLAGFIGPRILNPGSNLGLIISILFSGPAGAAGRSRLRSRAAAPAGLHAHGARAGRTVGTGDAPLLLPGPRGDPGIATSASQARGSGAHPRSAATSRRQAPVVVSAGSGADVRSSGRCVKTPTARSGRQPSGRRWTRQAS